jgi:hypothetical protein
MPSSSLKAGCVLGILSVELNVLYVILSDLTELSVKSERYSTSNKGNGHCVAMPKAFDARRRAMPGTDPNREGATVQH